MSDDAINRALDRVQTGRVLRANQISPTNGGRSSVTGSAGAGAQLGDRVFDVQRGQEGVIVKAPPGSVIVGRMLYVQFDQGIVCARPSKYLVIRPTPPPARG